MSFTGQTEATAITALLASVGTVLEDILDDTTLPVDFAGAPTPYIVVEYAPPVAQAVGRGLGVSEQGQPYYMPFQVTYTARTTSEARALRVAGDVALVGVVPTALNSNAIKTSGGASFPARNDDNKPTLARQVRFYSVAINATVDELA